MAPRNCSVRSSVRVRSNGAQDIYSLGLILREHVDGAPAPPAAPKTPNPPSKKRIQRLPSDHDPSKRPATSIDVARALPEAIRLAQ